jgi:DNA polymerase I-like protein with 3'-5' exonuclease and polymerase domains
VKPKYSTNERRARTLIVRTGSISMDYETRGLHPHARTDAAVGAIIVKAGGEKFIFREFPDWWDEVLEDRDVRKIGSNLQFDLMWNVHRSKLPIVRNVNDLMIESQLTHRYRTYEGVRHAGFSPKEYWEPNDLASILREQLGVEIKKGDADNPHKIYHEDQYRYETRMVDDPVLGKRVRRKVPVELLHKAVDWLGDWSSDMIKYMLEDIDYLEPAHEELERKLREDGQERVAWIENNSVFAVSWMKYNGILPDVAAWKDFIGDEHHGQIHDHNHLLWHLRRAFPEVVNWNSNPQVKKALESYVGSSISGTNKHVLKQLAPAYPKIALLQDERHLGKRLENWGHKFLQEAVCKYSGCGRFHPDWRQIGAETARFSCAKPNLQQIPREQDYRNLFIAPENYWLCSLDYNAIEVLVAAIFAKCPALIDACHTGNPHGATAAMTMGLSYDEWLKLDSDTRKDTRQGAKIVNFGQLFGGGVDGFIIQARDLFNVHYTEEQARSIIQTYYATFPELKYSKNWAYRAMDQPGPVEVRTLVGYKRILERWNRKPTSWLNTIIQSSAGHGIKSSFRRLMEMGLLPFLCLQVHDELVFQFPDKLPGGETYNDLSQVARQCMIEGMREVLGANAPVGVDPKAGKVWLK